MRTTPHAPRAGQPTPTSETAHVASAGRFDTQADGHPDSAIADGKAFATLQARAALAGIALHKIDGDDGVPLYVVTRWALTRELRTLADVAAFFGEMGVRE